MKKLLMTLVIGIALMSFSSAYLLGDDLIHYWNFDLNNSLLIDIEDGSHNGTLHRDVKQDFTGILGKTYNFTGQPTGVGGYVNLSTISDASHTNWSLSFWFNTTDWVDAGGSQAQLLGINKNAGDNQFWFVHSAAGSIQVNHVSTCTSLLTEAGLALGQWYHIVVTSDGDVMELYVNGTRVSGTHFCDTPFFPSENIFLGGAYRPDASNQIIGNYSGHLDEMGFWNRRLSQPEVDLLYSSGNGYAYPFLFSQGGQEYNATVFDTDYQEFKFNLTVNPGLVPGVFGILHYANDSNNRTVLGRTIINGSDVVIVGGLDIPATKTLPPAGTVLNTFFWEIILTYSNGTLFSFNTSDQNQVVKDLLVQSPCGSGILNPVQNFSFFIEEPLRKRRSVEFDATVDWWLGKGTESKNRSFSFGGNVERIFCTNTNQTVTATVRAEVRNETSQSDYENRQFTFNKLQWTNLTGTPVMNLMIPNGTLTTDMKILLKDAGLLPLEGYTIKLQRFYPEGDTTGIHDILNKYTIAEQDVTDSLGTVSYTLVENNVQYLIEVFNENNTLVKTQDKRIFKCGVLCEFQIIVGEELNLFRRFTPIPDFQYSLTFNNATNTFLFSWLDPLGAGIEKRFEVERFVLNGTDVVCNLTDDAESGIMTCAVGERRASYNAQAWRDVDSEPRRISIIQISVGDIALTFDLEGLMWSFLLLFTALTIGAWNPSVGVILYGVGFVILGIFGIIFVNPAIIIAQVALVVIFVWAIRT